MTVGRWGGGGGGGGVRERRKGRVGGGGPGRAATLGPSGPSLWVN